MKILTQYPSLTWSNANLGKINQSDKKKALNAYSYYESADKLKGSRQYDQGLHSSPPEFLVFIDSAIEISKSRQTMHCHFLHLS